LAPVMAGNGMHGYSPAVSYAHLRSRLGLERRLGARDDWGFALPGSRATRGQPYCGLGSLEGGTMPFMRM
jgi:hypothetical protein